MRKLSKLSKYIILSGAATRLEGLKIIATNDQFQEFINRFMKENGEVVWTLDDCIQHNIDWLYGWLKANGSVSCIWLMLLISANHPALAVDKFLISPDMQFILEKL